MLPVAFEVSFEPSEEIVSVMRIALAAMRPARIIDSDSPGNPRHDDVSRCSISMSNQQVS